MVSKDAECARQWVSDLKKGDTVADVFMSKAKQLMDFSSRSGHYLILTLFDKTGEIKAIMWDNGEKAYNSFENGDVVHVTGYISEYKGTPQITIETLRKCSGSDYELSRFLPRTNKDVGSLLENMKDRCGIFVNTHLKLLVLSFLEDPDFAAAFIEAPAAKSIHHAVIGGLVEHTSNVVSICEVIARLYPVIDTELLISGAILHDVGKVIEYTYDGPFDLSDEGKLIGHVVIGEHMIAQAIKGIEDFPEVLELKLRHMILSHHGKLEWGSPKRPKTLEAIALHLADYMDAYVAQFFEVVKESSGLEDKWSYYNRRLERQLYLE